MFCSTMMRDSEPVVEEVDEEKNQELVQDHGGERTGFHYAGDIKCLVPSKYLETVQDMYNFECREDDVWIVTFPRSGTTLTQELVWMVMNNFDYDEAMRKVLWYRSPFFEFDLFVHEEVKQELFIENVGNRKVQMVIDEISEPAYGKMLAELKSPRLIKTHFPISLLPKGVYEKKCKIVYVARNPKDVIPSFYYLLKLWKTSDYRGPFERWWRQFKGGLVPWAPFWPHIIEGWDHRHYKNVLFLFYEDIMKDMKGSICKVADFLSIPVTEEQVDGLVDHMDIRNFSKNKSVNCEGLQDAGLLYKEGESFVRKGKKREKPREMTPEILNEIEEWIQENYENTDLRFPSYTT